MDLAALQLTVHTALGSPDAPSRPASQASKLWALDEYAELGHGDFAYSARELAASFADQTRHRWVLVLAHEGERCVGLAHVQVPDADNQHMLALDLRLDPDSEPAVVLDALWSVIDDLARAERRDTIVVWVASALPGASLESAERVAPRTGSGAVRRTPVTDWLIRRGFALEQVEVASTLDVANALARVATWEETSAAASPAYDLVSWTGVTPPELQEAMAQQRARMSTDVPLGEIAMEPEVWDAARVRGEDEVSVAMGRSPVWTVARERATGRVVAHTLLLCPDFLPEGAYQEDTLVRREHRGHRLGLRVKAANLRQLADARPRVRRVHTWNADENEWMLAINSELGFRPTSVLGCWQLRAAGTAERDQ